MKHADDPWLAAFLLFALTTPSAMGAPFARDLSRGMRGDDVSALQNFLIDGGFLKISASTGYFGFLTGDALRAWQASAGISPAAGYFGSVSRGKMDALFKSAPAPIVTTTPTATTITTTTAGSPVRLKIPKLSVDAGFQYNGLKADGTMEVPSNIFDVGWFTGSVRPGEKGVAIVTGHVAQIRGGVVTKPGVFSGLYQLKRGDTLAVLDDKGASTVFVVREIRNYDPAADAVDVFTASDDGIHLNLITCDGAWNPIAASYAQRLVIFTDAAYSQYSVLE